MPNSRTAKEHMEKGGIATFKGVEYQVKDGLLTDRLGNPPHIDLIPYMQRGKWELKCEN